MGTEVFSGWQHRRSAARKVLPPVSVAFKRVSDYSWLVMLVLVYVWQWATALAQIDEKQYNETLGVLIQVHLLLRGNEQHAPNTYTQSKARRGNMPEEQWGAWRRYSHSSRGSGHPSYPCF